MDYECQLAQHWASMLWWACEAVPPLCVDAACAHLGVKLVERPMRPEINGLYIPCGSVRVVVVNSTHALTRRRFSACHEVAHVLIEKYCPHLRPYRVERVCNQFAGSVLMPGAEVLGKLIAGGGLPAREKDIDWLAREFNVSYSAMKVRLKELEVLDCGR